VLLGRAARGSAVALVTAVAALLAPIALGQHHRGCTTTSGCADVSISGHAEPQPIRRGEVSWLVIKPKNDGPGTSYGVAVHVDVPSQLKIIGKQVYGARSGCSVQGTYVSCDFGDFVSQQLGTLKLKVRGLKRGTWISKAIDFSSYTGDPNAGNNHVEITVGVQRRR
jgi:hypothetical protein